jgi:tetratricopeptide (TPR) repeat protein
VKFISLITRPIVARRLATARRLARQADRARNPQHYAKAAEAYRAVLALAPLRTDILVQYGNMLKDSGELSKADSVYRFALAERPDDADTYLQLGHCLKLQAGQALTEERISKTRNWRLEAASAYIAALTLDPGKQHARQELLALGYQEWQIESALSLPRGSQQSRHEIQLGLPGDVERVWHRGTSTGIDPRQARFVVAELFEILLKRPPDHEALESYSRALATGALQPASMMRNLLASEEFGHRAALHASVARYFARTIIISMAGRDPSDNELNAYSGALERGYALEDFLQEMMGSPEIQARVGRPLVSFELGQLAEALIAAHMTAEGCSLMFPSQAADGRPSVSEAQLRSMLHTLAMFARDALPTSTRAPSPQESSSSTSK